MVRPSAPPKDAAPVVRVTMQEWRWLAFAVFLGAAVRLAFLNRVAVDHYDEAIYAANVYFGAEEGYQFPGRQFNAPPLMPLLIETTHIVWSMTGLAKPLWLPVLPGLLCGIATIPSAWWIARRWFGPTAGATAMWLVALNEFHAVYSRTALTDVPVTLAILWAVFAAWKLLIHPTVGNGVIVGVLTAIAWWLKYSGWLPLAILLVGGAVDQMMIPRDQRRIKAWLIATVIAVFVAALLWSPVIADCRTVGGYSAVAANHRTFIQGWSSWGQDFVTYLRQYGQYPLLTGLGLMWVTIPIGPFEWRTSTWSRVGSLALIAAFMATFLWPQMLWILLLIPSVCGIISGLRAWSRGELTRFEIAAAALLSTWFCGLFLTTPLYHPYPRLLLPWWMSATLLTAWWIQQHTRSMSETDGSTTTKVTPFELSQGGAVLISLILVASFSNLSVWEDRRGLTEAASQIARELRTHSDRELVQVYGMPPIVLALREQGVAATLSGGPEQAAQGTGWLVVTSEADRYPAWTEPWPRVEQQFELVQTIPTQPSSLFRLDNGPIPPNPPPVEVRLYRHK